jgi:antitoxin ParD1/3/4
MNISLTPQLEEMIRQKIASGSYSSASEVVREALRLMELEDQMRELKLERLRQDLQDGIDSGFTEFDPEKIKRLGRKRMLAKKAK